jgi:Uma2 family endonuclease
VRLLARALRRLGERWDVDVQLPLAATADSEPEPDLAIRPRHDSRTDHPSTAHLVVEVAVISQALDRRKGRVYAQAGVPTYWLIDVPRQRVLEHADPDEDGYASLRTYTAADTLTVPATDITIAVADLFA